MQGRTPPHLTPCRFFAKGNCRDGDNCRFSHDPATQNNAPNQGESRGHSQNYNKNHNRGQRDNNSMDNTGSRGFRGHQNNNRGGRYNDRGGRYNDRGRQPNQFNDDYMPNNHFNNEGYDNQPQTFRGGNRGNNRGQQGSNWRNEEYNNRKNDRYTNEPKVQNRNEPDTTSPNINLTKAVDTLKELNFQRRQNSIDELYVNEVTLIGNNLFILLNEKNFVFVFDVKDGNFSNSQVYINTKINDVLLKLKTGQFGDIDGFCCIMGYTAFNEFEMYMR